MTSTATTTHTPAPETPERALRMLVIVPAFNAGDTTRGIESARAFRSAAARHGRATEIEFLYPRTTTMYDAAIHAAGFSGRALDAAFSDDLVASVMSADHGGTEFLTDPAQAGALLDLLMAEMRAANPDLVLYGFLPPVGAAAQILGIPSACYSPFPADRGWVARHFLADIPDELARGPLVRLPAPLRRAGARALSAAVPTTGFFRQPTTVRAARERGWRTDSPDLFGMLGADAQIVNDLPAFYRHQGISPHVHIAGPLFNRPDDAAVPDDIRAWFENATGPRVFVAMGSSGEAPYLLDAIEAVSRIDCTAVVLVPPHVATLEAARARLAGPARVLLTDAFVPAPAVNAMADVAVIHGGQGTVQTAVASGTPVVGVGMQWEQAGNLDKLVAAGSGIRLRRREWAPDAIETALRRVVDDPSYRRAAARLRDDLARVDGSTATGEILYGVAAGRSA